MVCDKAVCERWRVTKLCVKDSVCVCVCVCVTKLCVTKLCVKDGV